MLGFKPFLWALPQKSRLTQKSAVWPKTHAVPLLETTQVRQRVFQTIGVELRS